MSLTTAINQCSPFVQLACLPCRGWIPDGVHRSAVSVCTGGAYLAVEDGLLGVTVQDWESTRLHWSPQKPTLCLAKMALGM